jgi:hypothetical protein
MTAWAARLDALPRSFVGDGTAQRTVRWLELVSTARAEGVFLDPVYTGKAMAGYRSLLSKGRRRR